MTNAELVKVLSEFPPDAEIVDGASTVELINAEYYDVYNEIHLVFDDE